LFSARNFRSGTFDVLRLIACIMARARSGPDVQQKMNAFLPDVTLEDFDLVRLADQLDEIARPDARHHPEEPARGTSG
jgi:hypothetical protein